MAKAFLVKGARCVCKFGSLPGRFTVLDHAHFYINGRKLAGSTLSIGNTFDQPGFGVCKVNPLFPRPCIPAVMQWNKPYLALKTSLGGNLLTDESTATCLMGAPDCISVLMTGQIPLPGIADFTKATAAQQEDLDPMGESAGLTEHQIPFEVADVVLPAPEPVSIEIPTEVPTITLKVDSVRFVGHEGNTFDLHAGKTVDIEVRLSRAVLPGEAGTFFYKYFLKNPGASTYEREERIVPFIIPTGSAKKIVRIGFPERFSGTQIAVSFFKGSPFRPTSAAQNTVRYLNIIPAGERYEIIKAYWTAEEKIPEERSGSDFLRYTYAPPRKEICKNEDAFLHIHTRGLYGKEVLVELYERDLLPKNYKLAVETVVIQDNVVSVPFLMQEVYANAAAHRAMIAERGAFDLYCVIKVPYQGVGDVGNTYTMTSEDDLKLKIENADIEDQILSSIFGTKKAVIGTVEEEKEEDAGMITYHTYHDGRIIKRIPKKNKKPDYYKYVYHDKNGIVHNIAEVKWYEIPELMRGERINTIPANPNDTYDYPSDASINGKKAYYYNDSEGNLEYIVVEPKNSSSAMRKYSVNGTNKAIIVETTSLNYSGGDGLVIAYTFIQTARFFFGADQYAVFIGALAETSIAYKGTGNTSKDGTGFPSQTHVNGYGWDFSYQTAENDKKLIAAMKKFGCTTFCVGDNPQFDSYGVNNRNGQHDDHLHCGPMKTVNLNVEQE